MYYTGQHTFCSRLKILHLVNKEPNLLTSMSTPINYHVKATSVVTKKVKNNTRLAFYY